MAKLWINGTLTDKADARVSPFDHGFLYGDGVWEHFRVFGGKLFRPDEHLDLLFSAADTLGIVIPLSRDELLAAIDATLKANDRTDGYVRVIVTRGPGTIGPDPRKLDPQIIIIAEEYQPFPQELYEHGLHASLFWLDPVSDDPVHNVRTLNQLHTVRAKRHAIANGCLEAVLAESTHSEVLACTEGQLVFIRSGKWSGTFGKPSDIAFHVVTRILSDDLRMACGSALPKIRELQEADEAFVVGTACGVIGIVRLDGRDIGNGTQGAITKQIREQYDALTRADG